MARVGRSLPPRRPYLRVFGSPADPLAPTLTDPAGAVDSTSTAASYAQSATDTAGAADSVTQAFTGGPVSSLITDFSVNPAFFDANYGGAFINGAGQGETPTIATYSGFSTSQTYSLTGSSVYAQIVTASGLSGTRQNSIKLIVDASNSVEMMLSGGTFRGRVQKAGVNTDTTLATYSATTHAWWRVRESGGTVYFDTSPDATTWTNLGSTVHGLSLDAVILRLQAGYFGTAGSEVSPPDAIYDNLNTPGPTGTAYTQTVADTASAADSTAAVQAWVQSVADTAGAADTASGVQTAAQAITDTAGAVDSDQVASADAQAISDNIGAADTVATAQGWAQSTTDAAGAADSAANTASHSRTQADTAGAADSASSVQAAAPTITDTAGVADAAAQAASYTQTTADTAAVADSDQVASGEAATISDNAGAADSLTTTTTYAQAATDTAGAADSATAAFTLTQAVTDTASAADTTSSTQASAQTITDTAGAIDSQQVSGTGGVGLLDSAAAVDGVVATATYAQTITDTAGVVDSAVAEFTLTQSVTDTAGTTDSAASTGTYSSTVTDSAGAVDSQQASSTEASQVSDSAGAIDTVTVAADYSRAVTDTAGAADHAAAVSGAALVVTDAAGAADVTHVASGQVAQVADAIGMTDVAVPSATVRRTVIDTTPVGDSVNDGRLMPVTANVTRADAETDSAFVLRPTASMPVPVAVEVASAFDLGMPAASLGVPRAIDTQIAWGGVTQGLLNAPQASPETDSANPPRPTGSYPTAEVAERDLAFMPVLLVDDGTFGDAIDDADRVPVFVLKADWGRTGLYDHPLSDLTSLVEEVVVDRVITGSLPAEVGLVEGYASAELSVTLAGTWSRRQTSATRTNLMINPSFETATTGYTYVTTGNLGSISQRSNVGTPATPFGSYFLAFRPPDDGTSGYVYLRCPLVPVTPGVSYTASAYRCVVGSLNYTYVGMDWLDASGNQPIGSTQAGANIGTSGWARGFVSAVAPPTAVWARPILVAGTVDYNNYVRWDAVMVEVGNELGAYFDGSTPGASWAGVPHASTSSISVPVDTTDDDMFDPIDVFAPYRTDSPLYGQPVLRTPIYLETGFVSLDGPRLQRKFTGTVTSVNPSSGARTVKLGALDPTSSLRATVTTSGSALYAEYLARFGPDVYQERINSQWLIDLALRANGIYTSPPPRSNAILSVTGHGSMIPEIGSGGASEVIYYGDFGAKWVASKFGDALTTALGSRGRWWAQQQLTASSGSGFGFSMWLFFGNPAPTTDQQLLSFDITLDKSWLLNFGIGTDNLFYFDAVSTTGHRARSVGYTPQAVGWRFVGCHVAFGASTFTATFRINGGTYSQTVSYGSSPIGSAYRPTPLVNYVWYHPFTNFQAWKSSTAPTAPWQGEDPNWVPQADLDPGVNLLTGLPALQGVDSWELIKAVTDAEGSIFQFTEDGRPQFITSAGDTLHGRQPVIAEPVTADRNLADLVSTTDEATIRNVINLKTKRVLISDWKDYFKATTVDQFDTPPGTSVFDIPITPDVYDLPLNRGDIGVTSALASLDKASFVFYCGNAGSGAWSPGWDTADKISGIKSYIRVNIVDASQPWNPFTTQASIPHVYIHVERTSPSNMRITITNTSGITVRFATPSTVSSDNYAIDGDPALIIPARVVETEDAEELTTYTDNASVALYGPTSYDVGGSDETWRQLPDGLESLASEVLATTSHPVPVLDAVDVPHDPRRKIGQRIELRDPDGLGSVTTAIVGLTTTYGTSGASDKITVRPIAPPGLGLLDDATHGLLDSSLVLGP